MIFSLALSLCPFLVARGLHAMEATKDFQLALLWRQGELCLVATTLAAAGIGDILLVKPKRQFLAIIGGGGAVLSAFAGSAFFGYLNLNGSKVDPSTVNWVSGIVLLSGSSTGLLCHVLAGNARSND